MTDSSNTSPQLYSTEFISLIFILFFGFCNMSVFYSFYSYLERLGIAAEWRGIVVGLEPMTAFFLRPAVSVFIHAGNALTFLRWSLILLPPILCAYMVTTTLPGLVLLRICHGAAFVTLVSAGMVLLVHFIPQEKSAQGFGIMSLSSLVPYTIAPILTEIAIRYFQNEAVIYALVSMMAIPGIILIFAAGSRIRNMVAHLNPGSRVRPSMAQLWQNIRQVPVVLVLIMNLLVFFVYAAMFYFMKTFVIEQGLGQHVGVFFAVSMLVMIIFRTGLGKWLDAVGKTGTLSVLAMILSVFFMMLPGIDSLQKMIVSAVGYGVIMGCMLPLLNGLMFENSSRQFRGINSNLMFFMMDAGFFLCPMLMGGVLASGGTYTMLFTICAVISLGVVALTVWQGWWRSVHDAPNTGDNTD
jgi:MFS family permease